MRKIIISVIFAFFISLTYAQPDELNSLKRELSTTKEDTIKLNLITLIMHKYLEEMKIDSGMLYVNEGIQLSQKIKNSEWEDIFKGSQFHILLRIGNYAKALEIALEQLQKKEKENNPKDLADAYMSIAFVYNEQNKIRDAMPYYYKAKNIYEYQNDRNLLLMLYSNMGKAYNQAGLLDSALHYIQRAYEMSLQPDSLGGKWRWQMEVLLLNELGNIYYKNGYTDIALEYYQTSIDVNNKENQKNISDISTMGESYYYIAELHKNSNRLDSCVYYASRSFTIANQVMNLKFVLNNSALLMECYRSLEKYDSALKYAEIKALMKDSIYNQEKLKEVQNLSFNENLRQQDLVNKEAAAKAQRKNILLTASIAMFIPLFWGMIVLLSRRKIKSSTISFLGMLGTLLLFEFFSLLLHPLIGAITHHNPVYMILIMVIIASLIVPMHHKFEKYIRNKLVNQYISQEKAQILISSPIPDVNTV